MANKYLYSGATGGGTGADWANAYTTIAAAVAGMVAGDDLWIASDHSESQSTALNVSVPGSNVNPCRLFSVNRAGSVPPVAADLLAGATIATTLSSNLGFAGTFYAYGLVLNCGSGANAPGLTLGNSGGSYQLWEACSFNVTTTGAGQIRPTNTSGSAFCDWLNCTASFGATTQNMGAGAGGSLANFRWRNKPGSPAITGTVFPSALWSSSTRGKIELIGLDLSSLGSGKSLVGSANVADVFLINCKLNSAVTVQATPTTAPAPPTRLIGCNSTGNVERNELYAFPGNVSTETTILRTAGASDGTTPFSWKSVTNANAKRHLPLELFEGAVWNAAPGSAKTLTFHCVTDNVQLTNADIWVEAEYLGDSGSPVTTMISSAPATQLDAGTNLTSDSGEAWTTTGLTTPLKQKFSVSFTPQLAGPIRWRIKVAKPSTTIYVDPDPDLT